VNAQAELPDDGPGQVALSCCGRAATAQLPAAGDLYDIAPNVFVASADQIEIALFATELLSRHATAFRFGLVGLGLVHAADSAVLRVRVDGLCDWIEMRLQFGERPSPASSSVSLGEGAHECIRMVLVDDHSRRVRATRLVLISRQLARRLRGHRRSAPLAAIVEFCPAP
jgi:hypothetical protein